MLTLSKLSKAQVRALERASPRHLSGASGVGAPRPTSARRCRQDGAACWS
jgi:hypothetical protein